MGPHRAHLTGKWVARSPKAALHQGKGKKGTHIVEMSVISPMSLITVAYFIAKETEAPKGEVLAEVSD